MAIEYNPAIPNDNKTLEYQPSSVQTLITSEDAQQRANVFNYTLGEKSPGVDVLHNDIINGRENDIRDKVAMDQTMDNEKRKLDIIDEWSRKKAGGPITMDEYNVINTMTTEQLANPNTVMEKEFGRKVISDGYFTKPDGLVDQAMAHHDGKANGLLDATEELIARKQIIRKGIEDLNLKRQDQEFASKAVELFRSMVPFVSWANKSNRVEGYEGQPGNDFLGNNKAAQIAYLHSLPTDEFERVYKKTLEDIASYSITDALDFAKSVDGYTSGEKLWDNITSVLDIASTIPIGTIGKIGRAAKKAREADVILPEVIIRPANDNGGAASIIAPKPYNPNAVDDLAKTLRGTVANVNGGASNINLTEVFSSMGRTVEAGITQAWKNAKAALVELDAKLRGEIVKKDINKQIDTLTSNLHSFNDPAYVLRGSPYKADREVGVRILNKLLKTNSLVSEAIVNSTKLLRIKNEEALTLATQIASDQVLKENVHVNNAVMDISTQYNELSNTYSASVKLKKPSGEGFDNRTQAQHWASEEYKLKPGTYVVDPQGDGYVINITRDIDETDPRIRDFLIDTDNVTPNNFWTFRQTNKVISADNLVSTAQNEARKNLVHGTQKLKETLRQIEKPIVALSGKSRSNMQRFTTMLRDFVGKDLEGKPIRGQFFHTLGEFEESWQANFGKLPTEKEANAYFAYEKLHDLDHILRNLGIYRGKARQGIGNIKLGGPASSLNPTFEGKIEHKLDINNIDGQAGVLLWDPHTKAFQFMNKTEANTAWKVLKSKVDNEGFSIIKISNPFSQPLKEATQINDIIDYVITKDFSHSRLDWEQIPYKPGGHVEYDYTHFVKQPVLKHAKGQVIYNGDITLRPYATASDAQKSARNYDQARLLYKDAQKTKNETLFNNFVTKNLPESPAELKAHFEEGRLHTDHPIVVVRKGSYAMDDQVLKNQYKGAIDAPRDPRNLNNGISKEFAGDQNLDIISGRTGTGTEETPIFKLQSSQLIDPMSSIHRAANTLMRNQYLEDYRTLSAEHLVQEFWDMFETSRDSLRANPFQALFKPKWNEKAINREKLQAAKNFQQAVVQLLSTTTPMERNALRIKEKMYDKLFHTLGEGKANWVSDHLMWTIDDPIRFTRNAVASLKLGLLNVTQFPKQAQTLTAILGISPLHGAKGFGGYWPMRALLMSNGNPNIVDHFATIARGLGWQKEHFKEAYELLKRSGITIVSGDHTWLDDIASPKLFSSNFGKYIDKLGIFWKEGERMSRITAFNTAYSEWRSANKAATLDQKAADKIMARQDVLSVSMTKASDAHYQGMAKGVLNIPTQFFQYQLRMMDLFWGSKLTKTEKAGLLTSQAAFYGIPVGIAGTTLGLWPWHEEVNKFFLDKGIDTNNNLFWETMHKGILETMTHLITGKEYNVGEVYGAGGLNYFKDLFSGDLSVAEALMGASANTFGQIRDNMFPIFTDFQDIFQEGPHEGNIKLTVSDFTDVLRNISGVNNAFNMVYGMNVGKYITKNGMQMDDVNNIDAVLMNVFGIKPQALDDSFLMTENMKNATAAQVPFRKQIIKDLKFAFRLDDTEERSQLYKRVKIMMITADIPMTETTSLISAAVKGMEDNVDAINRKYQMDKILKGKE